MAKSQSKLTVKNGSAPTPRPATPSGFPERLKWHGRQNLWYDNFRDPTTGKRKPVYFGGDVNEAWTRFLKEKDTLDAGRFVNSADQNEGPVTVIQLAEAFLENLRIRLLTPNTRRGRTSDLDANTFARHQNVLEILCREIGTKAVNDLDQNDFLRLMPLLGRNAHSQWNSISSVRSLFLFGSQRKGKYRTDIPTYGNSFKCASLAERADDKYRVVKKKDSEWTPLKTRFILYQYEHHRSGSSRVATQRTRACLLLAINSGFYAKCCSDLVWSELNLVTGRYEGIRHKTQRRRSSMLWPETIEAIINGSQTREGLVFTSGRNQPLVKNTDRVTVRCKHCQHKTEYEEIPQTDVICVRCNKMTRRVDLQVLRARTTRSDQIGNSLVRTYKRLGLQPGDANTPSFKWLRHTFANAASHSDWQTLQFAMGHARNDVTSLYADEVVESKLQVIADSVRQWLWNRPCDACHEYSLSPGNRWLCLKCHTANIEFEGDDQALASEIYGDATRTSR